MHITMSSVFIEGAYCDRMHDSTFLVGALSGLQTLMDSRVAVATPLRCSRHLTTRYNIFIAAPHY